MLKALLAVFTFIADVLVAVAKKLVGLAFLVALLTLSSIITLILVLQDRIG